MLVIALCKRPLSRTVAQICFSGRGIRFLDDVASSRKTHL
jgi:hypothetical protein